jgi:hypothetical protein
MADFRQKSISDKSSCKQSTARTDRASETMGFGSDSSSSPHCLGAPPPPIKASSPVDSNVLAVVDDCTEPVELHLEHSCREATLDLSNGNDASASGSYEHPTQNCDEPSESYFSDPRLDVLVSQVEQGRKNDSRLFRWLKSENMLTYWTHIDSFRVEKPLLKKKVRNLDELLAILTAPVRAEYEWFVTEFLRLCRQAGYEAEDTSKALSLEINMFLDSIIKPGYQGRAMWATDSIKAQLETMIENWAQLKTWPELRISIDQPSAPTLEFFITNQALWDAARERAANESEAKMLKIFEMLEGKTPEAWA